MKNQGGHQPVARRRVGAIPFCTSSTPRLHREIGEMMNKSESAIVTLFRTLRRCARTWKISWAPREGSTGSVAGRGQ